MPASNEASATVTADTTPPTAPGGLGGAGRRQHGQPDLDGVDRQRRRRPLQRPPRHDGRLHPERREPDRAAHRHELQRHRPGASAPTTTRSPPRTPPGTSAPPSNEAAPTVADATAPTAPSGLTRPVSGQLRLAELDGRDRQRRRRHATTSTAAPRAASRRARPTGSRSRPGRATRTPGLAPGTYFYKVTAEDAAGNVGPVSNTATATRRRHDRPDCAERPRRDRRRRPGDSQLDRCRRTTSASSRYNVHRSTTPGFTPSLANRIAQPTGTSYTDSGLAAGTYFYKVTAEDAAGQRRRALQRGDRDRHAGGARRPRRRLRLRRGQRAPPPPTSPGTATTARSATPAGPAPASASSATRSPSTARTHS